MRKLFLITILSINSILSFGDYLDTPNYKYLKTFLKEEQQDIFNNLMKDLDFTIISLEQKINDSKNEKEKQNLEIKLNEAIREKEKLVENLNINIIKYPERYTEKALELNKDIKELISSYSKRRKNKCFYLLSYYYSLFFLEKNVNVKIPPQIVTSFGLY